VSCHPRPHHHRAEIPPPTRVKPSQEELEAAYCWENDDRVPGRPEMTEFRRAARLHQARWREAQGHPIGTQPLLPRKGTKGRPVGSRLPLEYARETGANFVTAGPQQAARERTETTEPHQSFDQQRLWADLLWYTTFAVNLFGDLSVDRRKADRAVRTWWPDAPGKVEAVRFVHSPGRFDPEYLNSLRDFDAAFLLDAGGGTRGVVAASTKYHNWAKPEMPKPRNRARNLEVAKRSGAFRKGAAEKLLERTGFCLMFLEHLLMLSMLQHRSGEWSWGRYVVVHPAGNVDYADLCERYRDFLRDDATFTSITLEDLLASNALPKATASALRARYVVPP
jgi:PD-(D/E)XK nuclease superfamily protein